MRRAAQTHRVVQRDGNSLFTSPGAKTSAPDIVILTALCENGSIYDYYTKKLMPVFAHEYSGVMAVATALRRFQQSLFPGLT